jgi:hypothetical protein
MLANAKGDKVGGQNRAIEIWLVKSRNCKIYGIKIKQLKLKGSKSHNCKT